MRYSLAYGIISALLAAGFIWAISSSTSLVPQKPFDENLGGRRIDVSARVVSNAKTSRKANTRKSIGDLPALRNASSNPATSRLAEGVVVGRAKNNRHPHALVPQTPKSSRHHRSQHNPADALAASCPAEQNYVNIAQLDSAGLFRSVAWEKTVVDPSMKRSRLSALPKRLQDADLICELAAYGGNTCTPVSGDRWGDVTENLPGKNQTPPQSAAAVSIFAGDWTCRSGQLPAIAQQAEKDARINARILALEVARQQQAGTRLEAEILKSVCQIARVSPGAYQHDPFLNPLRPVVGLNRTIGSGWVGRDYADANQRSKTASDGIAKLTAASIHEALGFLHRSTDRLLHPAGVGTELQGASHTTISAVASFAKAFSQNDGSRAKQATNSQKQIAIRTASHRHTLADSGSIKSGSAKSGSAKSIAAMTASAQTKPGNNQAPPAAPAVATPWVSIQPNFRPAAHARIPFPFDAPVILPVPGGAMVIPAGLFPAGLNPAAIDPNAFFPGTNPPLTAPGTVSPWIGAPGTVGPGTVGPGGLRNMFGWPVPERSFQPSMDKNKRYFVPFSVPDGQKKGQPDRGVKLPATLEKALETEVFSGCSIRSVGSDWMARIAELRHSFTGQLPALFQADAASLPPARPAQSPDFLALAMQDWGWAANRDRLSLQSRHPFLPEKYGVWQQNYADPVSPSTPAAANFAGRHPAGGKMMQPEPMASYLGLVRTLNGTHHWFRGEIDGLYSKTKTYGQQVAVWRVQQNKAIVRIVSQQLDGVQR